MTWGNEATQIVNLNQWKEERSQRTKEESFGAYFSLLNFNELISEARHILEDIQSGHGQNVAFKLTALLSEFDRRLTIESVELSMAVKEIKKSVEGLLKDYL